MTGFRGAAVARLAKEGNRFVGERLAACGLGTGEHPFLLALADRPGMTQEDLCRQLQVDRAHTARTLARLEVRGLLTRAGDPADSRKNRVTLTEAGRGQVPVILSALQAWDGELELRLGDQGTPAFDRLLAVLTDRPSRTL